MAAEADSIELGNLGPAAVGGVGNVSYARRCDCGPGGAVPDDKADALVGSLTMISSDYITIDVGFPVALVTLLLCKCFATLDMV